MYKKRGSRKGGDSSTGFYIQVVFGIVFIIKCKDSHQNGYSAQVSAPNLSAISSHTEVRALGECSR